MIADPRLTRRRFLRAAGAAGVASVTVAGALRPARAASPDLTVMDWTGYEIPELHQPFIAKHGASPAITVFSDLEEAWQKIAGGFRPDVMHADHWQIPPRRDVGLFAPWDTGRLANFPDLIPALVELPTLRRGDEQWGIPADWGINSICWRTDLVEPAAMSWNALWDPAHEGRIAMTAQMNDAVSVAALAAGIAEPFAGDPAAMAEIEARLAAQRPLLRFYWTDPTQLTQAMATGEVAIAFAWPAVYTELKKQGLPVAYMRPDEGVLGWAQGLLLMQEREGDEQQAYDFVDAWTSPETGRWLIENYGYGHANSRAMEAVDPAVLAELQIADPAATLANSFFIKGMTPEVQSAYVAMFERIKAGG